MLWAHRLAGQVGKHVRLDRSQVATELLTALHDHPDRSDARLVADLEARRPA